MDISGVGTLFMVIIGPLLLLAVIAWAMLRNRQARGPGEVERTERATRELYRQEDAAHGSDGDSTA
jgi:hypothetical protein